MQFFEAAYTGEVLTEQYLGDVLLQYPQIKKEMTQMVCEELNLCLTERVIGFGRSVTKDQLANNETMTVAGSKIQWTIMPWQRELFTLLAPPIGNGANFQPITFQFDVSWGSPGMVLMFQDGNGNYINVMLTTFGVEESGFYSYMGKIVTGDPTVTLGGAYVQVNQKVGWSYDIVAQCADTTTITPFVTPAWYENYTTTTKTLNTICSTGIQTMLWIELSDGSMCFRPAQEQQMFKNYLISFEQKGWYGTSTYNAEGVVSMTDQAGNLVAAGDGVFAQGQSSYIYGYSTNSTTGYSNPANYEAFRILIEDTIVSWSVQSALTGGVTLELWAGIKAYVLLQRVLQAWSNTSGGCCYVMDYESGVEYEVKGGIEFRQYEFSGFIINLRKCAVFDSLNTNGFIASGQTTPWESWRFILMTDTTCDGVPLIQYYSRAGCGSSNAFIQKYIPGTINPANPHSAEAVNTYSGYQVFFNSEGVWLLNDPSKLIQFVGTP